MQSDAPRKQPSSPRVDSAEHDSCLVPCSSGKRCDLNHIAMYPGNNMIPEAIYFLPRGDTGMVVKNNAVEAELLLGYWRAPSKKV